MPKAKAGRSGLVYSVSERGKEKFSCPIVCERCRGTTADGRQCARRSCIGTPFCWVHAGQLVGVRPKTYAGMGKGLEVVRKGRKVAAGAGAAAARAAPAIVFRKGDFIMPYIGETLAKAEYERRYVTGNEDSLAEYVIVDGAQRYVDGACQRRLPALANTAVGKKERVEATMAPVQREGGGSSPIRYLSSVQGGTNSKFTIRTAAHDWHGVKIPAKSAWVVATKPIREGDQLLTYYGDDYRVYTTPGFQSSSTKRRKLPAAPRTPSLRA